ncbi:unnamed protein product, partial [Ambrosiozyma monospora]
MSLNEFLADDTLGGGSWADDEIDVNSIEIPISTHVPINTATTHPHAFESSSSAYGYGDGGGWRGGNTHSYPPHYGSPPTSRFDNHDRLGPRGSNGYGSTGNRLSGPNSRSGSMRGGMGRSGPINLPKDLPPPYIAKFSNLPEDCTQKLIKDLFESRYTHFDRFKLLVDPAPPQSRLQSQLHQQKKKCAFVQMPSVPELQKVVRWNDIFIERLRIYVEVADFEDFKYVQDFNQSIGFDEAKEEERIEKLKAERGSFAGSRRGSSNNLPPLRSPERFHVQPVFQDSQSGPSRSRSRSISPAPPRKPRVNPFGAAKPVDTPIIPIITESTAQLKKVISNKSPVISSPKSLNSQLLEPQSVPQPQPSIPKRVNPFGSAKPVDTQSKQMEIERRLSDAKLNSTTFKTLAALEKEKNSTVSSDQQSISSGSKSFASRRSSTNSRRSSISLPSATATSITNTIRKPDSNPNTPSTSHTSNAASTSPTSISEETQTVSSESTGQSTSLPSPAAAPPTIINQWATNKLTSNSNTKDSNSTIKVISESRNSSTKLRRGTRSLSRGRFARGTSSSKSPIGSPPASHSGVKVLKRTSPSYGNK